MPELEIELIPLLSDNYAYLLRDPASGSVAVVDPAVAAPVLERIEQHGDRLDLVLLTHHHHDHVAGVPAIRAATGCRVIGPAAERHRLPELDRAVSEGDRVALGSVELEVLETPGHTLGHIAYWTAAGPALLCGDTLFALGCGRILEGDAAMMWRSLGKLAALPAATSIYCGHEYTATNARFALHVEPQLPGLRERAAEIDRLRGLGRPTIPTTIGEELATNPFLRAGSVERFAELRAAKDRF